MRRLDPAPFVALVQGRIDARLRNDPDDPRPVGEVLAAIGWDDPSGHRRWRRWNSETTAADRDIVENALDHLGVPITDLYPFFAQGPDGWCNGCAERVTSDADAPEVCPRCDGELQRFEVPDEREAQDEKASPWRVIRDPRRPIGLHPRVLDVHLEERRKALETFAEEGTWEAAGRAIRVGLFSGASEGAVATRKLAERHGWLEPSARGDSWALRIERRRAAQKAVRAALDDGSWSVVQRQQARFLGPLIDRRLLAEAAWLYFYDELPMSEVADRLWPRTPYRSSLSLRHTLYREWSRRGWPRRRQPGAYVRQPPAADRQCQGTSRAGERCKRYVAKGEKYCHLHDPVPGDLLRQARRRSASAGPRDLVDVVPFHRWLQVHALAEAGSVRGIHRRLGEDVIHYGQLAFLVRRRPRISTEFKSPAIRRATVERILAAWNDGTTFDDIYVPVPDQEEAADVA